MSSAERVYTRKLVAEAGAYNAFAFQTLLDPSSSVLMFVVGGYRGSHCLEGVGFSWDEALHEFFRNWSKK